MRVERWRDDVVPVSPSTVEFYRSSGAWAGLTIGHQFHRSAQVHGDSPAVITDEGTFSYRWVDEQTDRIAAGLAERGLDLGEAVLLQVENTVETVLAWYGIIKAGLVPVATLAAHRRREIESIASIVDAAAHVVAADYAKFDLVGFAEDLAARAGGGRQVFTLRGDARAGAAARLEDVGAHIAPERARQVVESIQARIDGDDVAVFQLSGGTTAEPKVIPRLHDDYWCNGLAYARRLGWDSSTRVAHILPLVHNAGIACAMHPAHAVGGALVLTDADPDRLLALFAESGTTDVMTFPAIASVWAAHPDFDRAMRAMKRVVVTVAKVTDASFRLFEDQGIRVLGLFGAGEGLIMVTDPDDPPEVRQHALGTPVHELDVVRILEPGAEEPCPDGTIGELCFTGPYTLRGYLRAPERNVEAFTSDGLYRSGDLVAARAIAGRRSYVFEGRAKDLINRGGEKINAAEVEALVAEIRGVRRVALIPVPDERLGERACLCLEVEDLAEAPDLHQVTTHLADLGVAKFKWPERLVVLPDLPRTKIGKIDKRGLIDIVVGSPPLAPVENV